jgi:hypothetical protein
MNLYLLFPSIHNVMAAEELCQEAAIATDIRPVPREISSDCGMCLACGEADLEAIEKLLRRAGFSCPVRIYRAGPGRKFTFLTAIP